MTVIKEIKLDVTRSYVKRQTPKVTSEFVFFSSNPSLNNIKIEKMSPTIRHKYKYFHSTVQRAKDRQQKFHFCRLPFEVRPQLNLSINASAAATLLEQRPEKNSGSERDSNPRPLRYRCNALPTELSKPHESGRIWVSSLNGDV